MLSCLIVVRNFSPNSLKLRRFISCLPCQNRYSNLKTTKLLKSLLLPKYLISITAASRLRLHYGAIDVNVAKMMSLLLVAPLAHTIAPVGCFCNFGTVLKTLPPLSDRYMSDSYGQHKPIGYPRNR